MIRISGPASAHYQCNCQNTPVSFLGYFYVTVLTASLYTINSYTFAPSAPFRPPLENQALFHFPLPLLPPRCPLHRPPSVLLPFPPSLLWVQSTLPKKAVSVLIRSLMRSKRSADANVTAWHNFARCQWPSVLVLRISTVSLWYVSECC